MAATSAWLDARIAWLQSVIEQYEAAMLAFATNGLQQSYSFDTGQQVVRVERQDGDKIWATIQSLYNTYRMMCIANDLEPAGLNARPDW